MGYIPARNSKRIVTLHWYDSESREGVFKNSFGDPIFANFEFESASHDTARLATLGDQFSAEIVHDTTFRQIKSIESLSEVRSSRYPSKHVVRCDIEVLEDIYGYYNRKVMAWTSDGLVEGVVTEASTQYAPLGKHSSILVEIQTFFTGAKLVGRIVPDLDA